MSGRLKRLFPLPLPAPKKSKRVCCRLGAGAPNWQPTLDSSGVGACCQSERRLRFCSLRGETRCAFVGCPDRATTRDRPVGGHFLSRREACQVTREQRGQPDVGNARQLHQQPFGTNSETTLWRHTIAECLEVGLGRLDWQTCLFQGRQVVFVEMESLSPCDQLGAPDEQVERD